MRKTFSKEMIALGKDKNNIFLTGDLGFMSLEKVQKSFGQRFINCGVSEQNMVGVAAGLARNNLNVFAYSIAPFIYARPFEQIRNDIVLSDLPVCLIGNGGGYAYGYQGPTHHAIEDCAAMNALGVDVLVPSFDQDLSSILNNINRPSYLRLGIEQLPTGKHPGAYKPWRLLEKGSNGVIVALGPLAGMAWEAILELPKKNRPSLWAVNNFNTSDIPNQFFKNINGKKLHIFEEHIAQGGLGMLLSHVIAKKGIHLEGFLHHHAIGYPALNFGSQDFHRKESGLDKETIFEIFKN
ncbi:transketolase [Gammaproteobacteria bacterium]|nr:transketolase [Gammaproteobacteria bacterium]